MNGFKPERESLKPDQGVESATDVNDTNAIAVNEDITASRDMSKTPRRS
jgi:hypothetical protein